MSWLCQNIFKQSESIAAQSTFPVVWLGIMKRHLLILVLLASFGCTPYPTFTNPIVKPNEAKRFDELMGVYQFKNPESGETLWLHIGRCAKSLPKGFHKFVIVSPSAPKKGEQGLTVSQYVGLVFKNKTSYIVQIPNTKNSGDDQANVILNEWGKSKIDGYTIIRLKQNGEQLQLEFLVEESIEKLVTEKILAGRIEQEIDETTDPPKVRRKNIVVTAETDELGKFFSNGNHDTLFKNTGLNFTKHRNR